MSPKRRRTSIARKTLKRVETVLELENQLIFTLRVRRIDQFSAERSSNRCVVLFGEFLLAIREGISLVYYDKSQKKRNCRANCYTLLGPWANSYCGENSCCVFSYAQSQNEIHRWRLSRCRAPPQHTHELACIQLTLFACSIVISVNLLMYGWVR